MNREMKLDAFAFLVTLALLWSHSAPGQEARAIRDCSTYTYASPFPTVSHDYRPRYHTVAHDFLGAELGVGPVTLSEYAILDAILDEAKTRLKPPPSSLEGAAYDQFAVKSLQTIDCMLVRHGFVYPPVGLVQLLSDGLDPTHYSGDLYTRLLNHRHNLGRKDFIAKRNGGPYYVVDCDIASYIYLAIGEVIGFPLSPEFDLIFVHYAICILPQSA
jgi:hypothetical protein